jgi:hypothetical protein
MIGSTDPFVDGCDAPKRGLGFVVPSLSGTGDSHQAQAPKSADTLRAMVRDSHAVGFVENLQSPVQFILSE